MKKIVIMMSLFSSMVYADQYCQSKAEKAALSVAEIGHQSSGEIVAAEMLEKKDNDVWKYLITTDVSNCLDLYEVTLDGVDCEDAVITSIAMRGSCI